MKVVAVGDLQLGDSAIAVGYGVRSRYSGEDLGCAFGEVRHLLADADIVFGNLESTLSDRGLDPLRWESAQMRGCPAYAVALRRVGFAVLNVANNHALQHGEDAFYDTVQILGREGIACCGLRGTGAWCARPVIIPSEKGPPVGFLGYCLRPRQYLIDRSPPFAEGTTTEILADVRRLAAEVRYVVVSLHWGEEFVDLPSEEEVELGHQIVDAGASLVLGHHPHVLRPVEEYQGGAIAYSLGNFVADMLWQGVFRRGGLFSATLSPAGIKNTAVLQTYLDELYRPTMPYGRAEPSNLVRSVKGLSTHRYEAQVARTVRVQRLASYRHAATNCTRFGSGMLRQLVAATVRNRITGLSERVRLGTP